ncbi:hypothetical protein CR513_24322, partial [Mucuna pruriens]
MTRQQKTLLRSPPVVRCRERRHVGEMAGNATAECAAVCCCMPCAVMDMVVLAAYKVPAGLVKKAMHKRKCRLQQQQKKNKKNEGLFDHGPISIHNLGLGPTFDDHLPNEAGEDELEVSRLEDEMWAQFNGTGFWRSDSQRLQQQPPHLFTGE